MKITKTMKKTLIILITLYSLVMASAVTIISIQNNNLEKYNQKQAEFLADQRKEEAEIAKMEVYDKEQLAIAISNRDCDLIDLEIMAEELGYNNINEACLMLQKEGYLIWIPKYEFNGNIYESGYTTPHTIRAETAREAGLID